MQQSTDQLRANVLQRLESLQRAGVEQLPRAVRGQRASEGDEIAAMPADPPPTIAAEPPTEQAHQQEDPQMPPTKTKRHNSNSWQPEPAESLFETDAGPQRVVSDAATLEILQQQVADCTRCEELASTRTQTVFGVGDPQARLCFLGEAPGADEDRLGEPFVGRGGQLLSKIIEACKLKREEVYILNMLKCRPPGNRNPKPDELCNCRPYLERQFELIQPEFICCLGAVAAQNLLETTVAIGKLRGQLHAYRGAKVVCTYHPAYLLRNPPAKKDAWEDMKFLMREMGVEL